MKQFYFAKRKLQFVTTATILLTLAMAASTAAQSITTFDAPGAGTGPAQGTYATNIDPTGVIVGFGRDANNARHGFVRSTDGSFTIFDPPGAGTGNFQGTRAYAMTAGGAVAGFFIDSADGTHAYVRSGEGVITVIDAPGAGTGPFPEGTFVTSPLDMNPHG